MNPSVSVVCPIYNDESSCVTILIQLEKLLSQSFHSWEIVVIDDASVDGSQRVMKDYLRSARHIIYSVHAKNQGIAKTYRELYKKAKGDVIVLFSLDGGWDTRDVIRLADVLVREQYDMVIGVRKEKRYTLWRSIVSSVYNFFTRAIFGVATHDAGSIKAMKKIIVREIPIHSNGVFDEAERIIRAGRAGYRIGFLPITHKPSMAKIRSGVRMSQVVEAAGDMIRLLVET